MDLFTTQSCRILITSLVFAAVCMAVSAAIGETYEWVDSQGVTHFTDNPASVPPESLPTLQKKEDSGVGTITIPSMETNSPSQVSPSGGDQEYWRSSFQNLRAAIAGIRGALPEKQDKLDQLRRKRLLYHKASDRQQIIQVDEEIKRDEARIKELEQQLQELELKASRAGVPLEWRQ